MLRELDPRQGRCLERLFLLAAAAMLLLPLIGHLVGGSAAQSDNRALAAIPEFPATVDINTTASAFDWTQTPLPPLYKIRHRPS